MAAVKQLMLSRREAREILDELANGDDQEARYTVAASLLDISEVSPLAVPPDLVDRLVRDSDPAVAAKADEVRHAISGVSDDERRSRYSAFGI